MIFFPSIYDEIYIINPRTNGPAMGRAERVKVFAHPAYDPWDSPWDIRAGQTIRPLGPYLLRAPPAWPMGHPLMMLAEPVRPIANPESIKGNYSDHSVRRKD